MNHENHTHGTGRALLYSKGASAFGGAPSPRPEAVRRSEARPRPEAVWVAAADGETVFVGCEMAGED